MALRTKFRSITYRNKIYFLIGFVAYIASSILLFLLFSRDYMGILITLLFVPFIWVAVLLFLTIKRWRWLAYGLIGGYLLNVLGTTIQILSSGVISALIFIGWAVVGAPIATDTNFYKAHLVSSKVTSKQLQSGKLECTQLPDGTIYREDLCGSHGTPESWPR